MSTADAEATLGRIEELEGRVAALESEIADMKLASLIGDRRETPADDLLTVGELAESVDRADLLEDR